MKYRGLNVDTEAIGAGLYELIVEKGEEAIVAFGMIPLWCVETFERELRRKIISVKAEQLDMPFEELLPHIDDKLLKAIMDPIIHEVTLGIYAAAAKAGKLCV